MKKLDIEESIQHVVKLMEPLSVSKSDDVDEMLPLMRIAVLLRRMQRLETEIAREASKEMRIDSDDFNPADYAGGNFDDAWMSGMQDGHIEFACALQQIIDGE